MLPIDRINRCHKLPKAFTRSWSYWRMSIFYILWFGPSHHLNVIYKEETPWLTNQHTALTAAGLETPNFMRSTMGALRRETRRGKKRCPKFVRRNSPSRCNYWTDLLKSLRFTPDFPFYPRLRRKSIVLAGFTRTEPRASATSKMKTFIFCRDFLLLFSTQLVA